MRFVLVIGIAYAEFVATNEWQVIPEDEPLPEGLHYSIDMTTGVKMAKLLTPEGNDALMKTTEMMETPQEDTPPKPGLTDAQKESIKKINDYLDQEEMHQSEHRSFDDLGVELVQDFDLMKNITGVLEETSDPARKERALEELEFLVHQVDNAGDFCKLDGVKVIQHQLIHGETEKIKVLAAETIAAAAQGNSKVKVEFLNGHAVSNILSEIVKADSHAHINKLLYPLGAILRDFPYAQQTLYRHGGANILSSLAANEQTKNKSIRLIADFLREDEESLGPDGDVDRRSQYNALKSRNRFLDQKICNIILPWIVKDATDSLACSLITIAELLPCHDMPTALALQDLMKHYDGKCKEEQESKDEDDIQIFCPLSSRIAMILSNASERNEL